jgi:phage gp36-like protein
MAYSTQTDLLNRMTQQELIELTDDDNVGEVDAAKVTAAIAAAAAVIDAYAGSRYTLPLAGSQQVKSLSIDLAIYELEKRRRRVREETLSARDAALAMLRDIARGRATLQQPTAPQTVAQEVKTPDRTERSSARPRPRACPGRRSSPPPSKPRSAPRGAARASCASRARCCAPPSAG